MLSIPLNKELCTLGKEYKIMPGDIVEGIETEKGITVQVRKRRTLKDIIGLVKAEGDAVGSKKSIQKGLK